VPDVHHIFSPSSAYRHLECQGYLIGPEITDEPNDAAREGTVCHKLLEFAQYGLDPDHFTGQVLLPQEVYNNNTQILVNADMVSAVRLFMQTAKDMMAELEIDPQHSWPERHLVHPDFPDEVFGGTSDFTAINVDKGVLLVMDLKYGVNPVKASSPQLFEYAFLAISALPKEDQVKITELVFVIVQPRVSYGDPVSVYKPTIDEAHAVWAKLNDAINKYLLHRELPQSPPELLVTGSHCKYCPRQLTCPAITRDMNEMVALANIPLDISSDAIVQSLIFWSEKADAIKGFLKRVEGALHELASRGVNIPGKKLVASFGNRVWDPEMTNQGVEYTMRRITRTLGIPAKDQKIVDVKSPAQIEKHLREANLWKGDKELQKKFHELTHRPIRGAKLVNLDDPGEPVTPQLAEDLKTAYLESHTDD
jgi:hypothetical protein